MRHWGKAVFGTAVTVFLLWFVLKDVDFGEVVTEAGGEAGAGDGHGEVGHALVDEFDQQCGA